MLGTIAHRAGLGLDVNYVGKTRMNKKKLRDAFEGKKPSKKGDGNDTNNVSDAEVTKFGEYEESIVSSKKSEAERGEARKRLFVALKSKDPISIAKAQQKVDEADDAAAKAAEAVQKAETAWTDARNEAEPPSTRLFRTSLLKCSCVAQLFDPWYTDENTHDTNAPEPNMQRGESTGNERLHSHHLHITVYEPKIL